MRSFVREAWADVQDSSQEQTQSAPIFGDGISQSQSSCNPSQLFPATPDSFEGGASQSQQTLRQRFAGCALNSPIESIDEDLKVDISDEKAAQLRHKAATCLAEPTLSGKMLESSPEQPEEVSPPGSPPTNSRQVGGTLRGGMTSCETPELKQELPTSKSSGWSIHTLQTHASAMAASAASPVRNRINKQKRGSQPASQTPLGKRRATSAAIGGSPNTVRATPMETSTQVLPQCVDVEDVTEENQENPPERRLQKRCAAVISIKSKDEYKLVRRLRQEGVLQQMVEAGFIEEVEPPSTPVPENIEDTSKRSWEKGVQTWRDYLRTTSQAYERFCRR